MKPAHARFLMRLYPRSWRDRYGAEFEALLEAEPSTLRAAANVIRSAMREHVVPTQGGIMQTSPASFATIATRPSAIVPLAMSLAALAVVLGHVAVYGIIHEADEGSAAHIWQILMVIQVPLVAFFAIKWLPRARKETLVVLAMMAAALAANVAAVLFLT